MQPSQSTSRFEPISRSPFGRTPDGELVELFTLRNRSGLSVDITNYGARIVKVLAPGSNGKFENITLGYDSFNEYANSDPGYFGATIGRVANRIGSARFTINGDEFHLNANNGANCLHGGLKGFDKKVWSSSAGPDSIAFNYLSPDGEEGFPGNLRTSVIYQLTGANRLRIHFEYESDAATPVMLTNHSYWNLRGAGKGDILDQILAIRSSMYTPVNSDLIPTGSVAGVEGTPVDFRTPKTIGRDIKELLTAATDGYDHNFIIDSQSKDLHQCARMFDPGSGRVLDVSSTYMNMQFYSGGFMNGLEGSGGIYIKHAGGAFEPQICPPDSINNSNFDSPVIPSNQPQRGIIEFKFGTATYDTAFSDW